MITKVTSANYNDYTLLFNQADAALKEANGEPTEEFIEIKAPVGTLEDDDYEAGDSFDNTIQYFDEQFVPVNFEDAADFNARDLEKKWYRLNEAIIYDLDTYFGRLKVLANIDYNFLRLPIDEPTFDIVDGGNNGRRIIEIPDAFKSGISVQGDETAEILFFSIDRYYDATDLWSTEMNYIIQWKTDSKNGVTRAFVNKDGRPFLDNGKLYFGWPISSEITKEAGNVTFSVRIFRFGEGTNSEGKPKLAFGLNTQTATTKINESIAFEFKNDTEFEDAETINKTSDIISRVFNSTVMSETQQATSPTPIITQNILPYTEQQLASRALQVISVEEDVYTLATDDFDEETIYYNGNHEVVTGLNRNIYRKGFYYTKETLTQNYYEFDYNDIYDKIQQMQAIAPSGIITYSGISAAQPGSNTVGGRMELVVQDDIVFKRVDSETALLNHKYYEKDEDTGKYIIAKNVVTKVTDDSWRVEDRVMDSQDQHCKYFERFSPQLIIDENAPVGCYWLVAYNNESRKAMSSVESYKIWIPGPVDLTEDNVKDFDYSYDDNGFIRIQLDEEHNAPLQVGTQNVYPKDTVKDQWYRMIDGNFEPIDDFASITFRTNLALLDEKFKIEYFSSRNKKDSDTRIERKFRITDIAHKFQFDTVADSPGEEAHPVDNVKVINTRYNQPDAYKFKIDFSENLDENDKLNILSDNVAYRFRIRQKGDVVENIFLNDKPGDNNGGDFILTTFDELKDIEFEMSKDNECYYVEVINIVNEDFDLDALNAAAAAVAEEQTLSTTTAWAPYEARISRTEYRQVLA